MLRKVFGPEREKVTEDWRTSHEEYLLIFFEYYSGKLQQGE
jgi:hypothetical protein